MIGAAVAAVIVAAVLIFVFVSKRNTDSSDRKKIGYVLIPVADSTDDPEMVVRSCYWDEVFRDEDCGRRILLVLMHDGENAVAESLAEEYSIVDLVRISELASFLKNNEP